MGPTTCFCQQFTMPSAMIEAGTRVCAEKICWRTYRLQLVMPSYQRIYKKILPAIWKVKRIMVQSSTGSAPRRPEPRRGGLAKAGNLKELSRRQS